MAGIGDLKVVLSIDARLIKLSATVADALDMPVTIRHNHNEPTTPIPVNLFVQDVPLGTIDATDGKTETVTVVPNRSKPSFKVKIVRAGSTQSHEVDIPWDALPKDPKTAKTGKGLVIKVVNPPRDADPASGLFIVTVTTENDGKPQSQPFTATAAGALDIRQQTATGLVPMPVNFTPMAEGVYQLYIGFFGNQITVAFQLTGGQSATVTLRK